MTQAITISSHRMPDVAHSLPEKKGNHPLVSKTNDAAMAVIKSDRQECKICSLFNRFITWLKDLYHRFTQLFNKHVDKIETSVERIPPSPPQKITPPKTESVNTKEIPTEVQTTPKKVDTTPLPTAYMPPQFSNRNNNCWYHASLQIIWAMGSMFYDLLDAKCQELGKDNTPKLLEALKNLSIALQFAESNDIKSTSDIFEKLLPQLNHSPDHSQKDPSEAFFGYLFPYISEFFINIGKRQMLGDDILHSYAPDPSHILHLAIPSDTANLQQILDREFEAQITNAEAGISEKARIKQMMNPNFIFLQMVRFDNDMRKIGTKIELSANQRIDLSKAIGGEGENIEYELIGAIIHEGPSKDGGHYVANVLGKNPKSQEPQWYFANDLQSNPIPISAKEAQNSNGDGYIYLFRKVSA